jgi:eukaryotic-like serine/threonine-protein kinase
MALSEERLLFVREGTLMAQPFDVSRMAVNGQPVVIAENVQAYGEMGPTRYAAFAAAGPTLVYREGISLRNQLVWFDRHGARLSEATPSGSFAEPCMSSDGRLLVVARSDARGGNDDLWTMETSRGVLTRLTFDSGVTATLAPDGRTLAYASNRAGLMDLYLRDLASGRDELLMKSDVNKWPDDFSPNGEWLLYESTDPATGNDLYMLSIKDGAHPTRPYLKTNFSEQHANVSPDGHWAAYASDESGQREVYVQRFPDAGGKIKISTQGGGQPMWREDGREIFYLTGDGTLMSVPVTPGDRLEAGLPAPLFRINSVLWALNDVRNDYVVSADGQRILAVVTESEEVSSLTVVTNWAAGLMSR